jgi:hypothetical protein
MGNNKESNRPQINDNEEIWETATSDYCILVGLIVVFVISIFVLYLALYIPDYRPLLKEKMRVPKCIEIVSVNRVRRRSSRQKIQ